MPLPEPPTPAPQDAPPAPELRSQDEPVAAGPPSDPSDSATSRTGSADDDAEYEPL
ncbi:hypothetical protein ACFW2D_03100 [Streptomyces sp. NPDC058914]|uniref:hypothetical protein n=1 Tax=Streptomyces sp. NPDC058914 TaxID=3346671 RepID=UPI0036CC41B4